MKKPKHTANALVGPPRRDDSSAVMWAHNPQAVALRVDLQNGVFWVLPYCQFAFAYFARETDCETLRISFTTHDVRVLGRNLSDLGLALQKLAVDWIREIPRRYNVPSEKGAVFIERIDVTKVNEDDSPPA